MPEVGVATPKFLNPALQYIYIYIYTHKTEQHTGSYIPSDIGLDQLCKLGLQHNGSSTIKVRMRMQERAGTHCLRMHVISPEITRLQVLVVSDSEEMPAA